MDGARGEEFKRRRLALRMSACELAEKAGMHRNTVRKIEQGVSVADYSVARLDHALGEMENGGPTDPRKTVQQVIELPDGTRVTTIGSPERVAETATAFLRQLHGS